MERIFPILDFKVFWLNFKSLKSYVIKNWEIVHEVVPVPRKKVFSEYLQGYIKLGNTADVTFEFIPIHDLKVFLLDLNVLKTQT